MYEQFGSPAPAPGSTPAPDHDEAVGFFESLGFGSRPAATFGETPEGPLPGSPEYARAIHEAGQALEEGGQAPDDGQGEGAGAPVAEDYHTALSNLGMDAAEQAAVREGLQQIGVTPDQARKLVEWHQGHQAAQAEKFKADAVRQLQAEWGSAYTENLRTAQQAIDTLERTYGLNGELRKVVSGPAGNDPAVIRLLFKLGRYA